MIQMASDVWASFNRTTLHENRMVLINHMEEVLDKNLTAHYGEGRGIVMVAGNADTLWRVKWSLQMLRSYGSTLPVQVVSCFPCIRTDDSTTFPANHHPTTTRSGKSCVNSEQNS